MAVACAAVLVTLILAAAAQADYAGSCLSGAGLESSRIQADGVPVAGAIETALGPQDGMIWFCPAEDQFDVGVAPGPQDLASATAEIDAIVANQLGAAESAWFEACLDIQSVPYSLAQLDQAQAAIAAQVPAEPTPSAWWVAVQPDPQPIVEIVLANNRTRTDESAAQQIVSQYGGMVTLTLSDSGPLIATAGSGQGTPPPSPPVINPAPSLITPPPSPMAPPASATPPAIAPSLGALAYRRHEHRVLLTVLPGSVALHHVVVSVASRTGRLLARKTLALLSTTSTVALRLGSAPAHITLRVRARSAAGAPISLQRNA